MISLLKSSLQLIRLDKPTGVWLLFLPCVFGIFLAKPYDFPFKELCLFFAGAFLLRSAGCIYNDIIDQDFDAQVQRTSSRPLADKSLNLSWAIFLLSLNLISGLIILLQFPLLSIKIGCFSLILVGLYPWMKRWTYWPQAFLGLTFNWGILMGWSLFHSQFTVAPFCLYTAGICWTLGYDTIYAHQDKQDDLKIGVKSSALYLGSKTHYFLKIIYSLMMFFLILAGYFATLHWSYYLGLIIVAFHLQKQIKNLEIDNISKCLEIFKSNVTTGLWLALAFYLGNIH